MLLDDYDRYYPSEDLVKSLEGEILHFGNTPYGTELKNQLKMQKLCNQIGKEILVKI